MSDRKTVNKTVIGPTIVIRGKLRSDEDLVLKGRVDAEITSTKSLLVEKSGIVKANVDVESVEISGVLVGDIVAKHKAEIASDGRMVGDLMSPKIVIRDGAAFRGQIDMPNFDTVEEPVASSEKPAESVAAVAATETPAQPGDGDATVAAAGGGNGADAASSSADSADAQADSGHSPSSLFTKPKKKRKKRSSSH